ncbi:MAG: hypothetical protein R2697_01570 [Ilumatobacteraceae bacterium]
MDRPDLVAGDVVDPDQVDRGRDLEIARGRDVGDDVVEDDTGTPVDPDDLGGRATNECGGIARDGEAVGTIGVETDDGAGLVDAVAADAPEVVIGDHPAAVGSRPVLLHQEFAPVGVGRHVDPVTAVEPRSPSVDVEQEGTVADQGEAGLAEVVGHHVFAGRGDARQSAGGECPDGTVGGDLGERTRSGGAEFERDRVATRRRHDDPGRRPGVGRPGLPARC